MSEHRSSEEIAQDLVSLGIKKAGRPLGSMILLALLAGAYIGFAAHLATLAVTGDVAWYGAKKLLMGLVFSLGLMLVLIPGAELFTGNCLMSVALLEKKIGWGSMFRNWVVVWLGNLVGGLLLALWMVWGTGLLHGPVAVTAVEIAASKCALTPAEVFFRGIGANWLVCLGVLMAMATRNPAGKILGVIFPVTAFVAMGFEHSVANMYFLPAGLMLSAQGAVEGIFPSLTAGKAVMNIFMATLGNIAGGAFLTGGMYWGAYVRKGKSA